MKNRFRLVLLLVSVLLPTMAFAQLRRPGFVTIEREDRTESRLMKEQGAIYLEGMVEEEVIVRITQPGNVYATLSGERWLGNLHADQNATLLAVSERAYRVRAQAKQGQVAGWVSKSAVEGLPEDFEENLRHYHARYELVKELIENQQIALGMTVDEVMASLGPPDRRSSKLTGEGRTDTLEYISYQRVPQPSVTYDRFGRPVRTTVYVEVESGRVFVEFVDDTVTSIEETEGINFAENGVYRIVPRPVFLF